MKVVINFNRTYENSSKQSRCIKLKDLLKLPGLEHFIKITYEFRTKYNTV